MEAAYKIIILPIKNYVHNVEDVLIKQIQGPHPQGSHLCYGVQNGGPRHLYVICDGKITDGDWFYDFDGVWERMNSNVYSLPENARKVIASTDKSIGLPWINEEFINTYIELFNDNKQLFEVVLEVIKNSKGDIADGGKYLFYNTSEDGSIIIKPSFKDYPRFTFEEVKKIFEYAKGGFYSEKNLIDFINKSL